MSLEQKINYQLNKYPAIKKVIKRGYQLAMYAISPKIKSEGNITRLSPDDPANEYFFGYYDKSPWDASGRCILCMKAKDTWSDVSPREPAEIILINTTDGSTETLATTHSWNVQQGCMVQWLGPDYSAKVLYNDCRDGKYCSVILNITDKTETVISAPVYSVASDGKTALTLDFSRLYSLRPGYGYYNVSEVTKGIALPGATAIWSVDLENGVVEPLLKYTDFAAFKPRPEMQEAGSVHKVNHIMLSPNGKRFMVLYRWFCGQRKYTRLITCNTDGTGMYVLSDDDMVSHCCWKDDESILAFENKKDGGPGYYLMKDKTQEYTHFWSSMSADGHPSYSPDRSFIVTDTYPDRARVAEIKLMDGTDEEKNDVKVIAKVFAPFKYDNDTRCDLHPRWNHAGDKICFDSVFEGHRGLYVVSAQDSKNRNEITKEKKRIVYVFTSCKRSGPVQIMYNLISNLDRNIYEPYLITLYDEVESESDLDKFIALGVKHKRIPVGKKQIITGKTERLKLEIKIIDPSIIHSMGVFPDFAVSKMGFNCQVITLHNYMHEDYLTKFGTFKGSMLELLQKSAVKRAAKVWTCSESLSKIYETKEGKKYDYIRNGVDVSRFTALQDKNEIIAIRKKLKLPRDHTIFIYTGQFIDRKDQAFLLDLFSTEDSLKDVVLLLLGAGVNYEELRNRYERFSNIVFTGNVLNVEDYLKASDYYISCSHSEGLPTSVLEAMSCGLPVILSNIVQHEEIIDIDRSIGFNFELGNKVDCLKVIKKIMNNDYQEMSNAAYRVSHNELSAQTMSKKYQMEYAKVIKQTEEN